MPEVKGEPAEEKSAIGGRSRASDEPSAKESASLKEPEGTPRNSPRADRPPTRIKVGPIEIEAREGVAILLLLIFLVVAAMAYVSSRKAGPRAPAGSPSSSSVPALTPSSVPTAVPAAALTAVSPPAPSPPALLPSPTLTSVAPAGPMVKILSPSEGTPVIGSEGVLLQGTLSNPDGRALYVFKRADNGQFYLVGRGPVPVDNGQWSVRSGVIGQGGSDGDNGHRFALIAALANPECQKAVLSAPKNSSGDIRFAVIPAGCTTMTEVGVIKKAP